MPSPVDGELSQEKRKTGVKKKEERKAVICSTVVQCTLADLRTALKTPYYLNIPLLFCSVLFGTFPLCPGI